jgi:heme-degrading monooxygenase HmoA
MVLEIATFSISPGHEDDFVSDYRGARHLLERTEGCHSVRMTRGVESPSTFVLMVQWDSVQAHEQNFRAVPEVFGAWRGAIGPHFATPPHVEHYADVD